MASLWQATASAKMLLPATRQSYLSPPLLHVAIPINHLLAPFHSAPTQVKHLIIVQPTAWAKMLLFITRPFVSAKAADKVKKVRAGPGEGKGNRTGTGGDP